MESPFQIHPIVCSDIFKHIMSYIPEKNKFGKVRVENYTLSLKMCTISKQIRSWWRSLIWPTKFATKDIFWDQKDSLPLRIFLGRLNLKLTRDVKETFPIVKKISTSKEVTSKATQRSFLDLIHKVSSNQIRLNDELDKASETMILDALSELFPNRRFKSKKLELADLFIQKIVQKTGTDKLAIEVLQRKLGFILSFHDSETMELSYEWIKKKGLIFTADAISQFLEHSYYYRSNQPVINLFENYFSEILVDTPRSDGDHLVHWIVNSNGQYEEKKKYLRLILEKFPDEIYARNKEGCPFICLLFNDKNYRLIQDLHLHEELFWKQREDCHERIKWQLGAKLTSLTFSNDASVEYILNYLSIIKDLFSSNESFEKWLVEPMKNGDSLLHSFASWSFTLIERMIFKGFFTEEKLELKDRNNRTVRDIQYLYKRLIEITAGVTDRDVLSQMVGIIPWLIHPQTLFNSLYYTFLHESKRDEHFLSELILIAGSNRQDDQGNTLLHRLFNHEDTKNRDSTNLSPAIAFLMDRGADPSIKNNNGQTVFDIAIEKGWNGLLSLLK